MFGNSFDELAPLRGEKASLVAVLAERFPALWSYADHAFPELPYVHVFTSVGQLSWPVAPEEMTLFEHVPYREGANWVRRSSVERQEMLRELAERLAADSCMLDAVGAVV